MVKAKLWTGKRFKACERKVMKTWQSKKSADAICAAAWRKKYWAKKMASMAAAWRRRKRK